MSNALLDLFNRVSALERRMSFHARHAPVDQVDADKAMVRLDLGEDDDGGKLLTPWIPYAQFAGALKVHTPPSKGQQMTYMAPGGDTQQAIALPMTWSDHNQSPSKSADENVITFGDVRIKLEKSAVVVTVGGFHLSISGEGLAMAGGAVAHNEQDIGSTHRHPDVMPGPGTTGTPIAGGPSPKD